MPWTGVKTSDDEMPPVLPDDAPTAARIVGLFVFCFFVVVARSAPPAAPSMPVSWPIASSPYSDEVASPNARRFIACAVSLMRSFSFHARARLPPRLRFLTSSGAGSAFLTAAWSGSCHFSILALISSTSLSPAPPSGAVWWRSMRAASVTFAATTLSALRRSAGGALSTRSQ